MLNFRRPGAAPSGTVFRDDAGYSEDGYAENNQNHTIPGRLFVGYDTVLPFGSTWEFRYQDTT